MVDDRPGDGVFRVNKRAYTSPSIFEEEMEKIFESGWVYLCHESQVPRTGDYFTTFAGRQAVAVVRQKDGSLAGFLNVCPHRSSILLPFRRGSLRSTLTCRFHGWVFDLGGKCLKVKFEESGGYPDARCSHRADIPAMRVETYRGFVFGSLERDVQQLGQYLGPAAAFLDLLVDQSPNGLEVLQGSSTYVCRHNWKIQVENVVDGYHTPTVHRVFGNTIRHRETRSPTQGMLQTETGRIWGGGRSGCYDLGHGHMSIWTERAKPEVAPVTGMQRYIEESHPAAKAEWMLRRGRNLLVFPNLIVNDLASSHIRVARPIAADRTEVTIWCIAPVGEPAEARFARLRKFEDFFLVTGMATGDDVSSLDAVQVGVNALANEWIDYTRGMATLVRGADSEAKALGFDPLTSNASFDHETSNHGMFRYWLQVMQSQSKTENKA
ncbi:MAG: Rieske 2Fe-2S domain-containing protein [Pirellulales bacterium]